jgi:hypothetical protein
MPPGRSASPNSGPTFAARSATSPLRIDHIGSTAVPGLAAKPIIDVQVSVASFEPVAAFKAPLEGLGYVFRADNTERTKRYFPEPTTGHSHRRFHRSTRPPTPCWARTDIWLRSPIETGTVDKTSIAEPVTANGLVPD